ncbi:MAG TPA: LuxR C-terminal-related transcriptional regulator, partial [Candidatus Dormibacteraeota bacterium]|nr:LuxR C-terminal-related transcriptional regulator [Candidatus Dormibacteraeota bacterium]
FLGRDPAAAERWLRLSLQLFEQNGDRTGVGRATASMGTVLFLRGELAPARATLENALSVAESAQDQWGQGMCRTYLGLAATRGGDRPEADRQFRAALEMLRPLGDITMLTFALAGLALNYGASERRRAVRLAAAATGIRHWIGGDFAPMMTEAIAGLRAVAAQELGADAAREEWEAGQSVGPDEALLLALPGSARTPRSRDSVLSGRELEIAGLVAEGLPNGAIADRLHLSTRTVENHVFHMLGKLGLDNRTQLATWLVAQQGISR